MRYCSNCGAQIEDNATFCQMCGAKIKDDNANGETTVLNNTGEETTAPDTSGIPASVNVHNQPAFSNKKKNLVKGAIIATVLAAVVIVIIVILAVSSATKNNDLYDENAINDENLYSEFTPDYETGYAMSDNIFDYQIKIGNIVYQFPMSVEEFTKTGLSLSKYEDPNEKLSSGYSTIAYFDYQDGSSVVGKIVNFSKNEALLTDCHITGVIVDYKNDSNIKFNPSLIKLAKGITLNESTIDEVKAAYGEPNEVLTGDGEYNDNNTYVTYSEDIYNAIDLTFNEIGILCAIEIENIKKPNDVKEIGPSNNIPELVKKYIKPTELGTDLTSGIFELEGELYQLPLPLNEMLENGWSVVESSASTIPGRSNEYVNISKGNVQIDNICIKNYEEYEIPIKYGIIEKMDTTSFSYGKEGRLVIANNIDMNMNVSNVDSIFEAENAVKEDKGDGWYDYKVSANSITVDVCVENKKVSYIVVYWSNN